MGSVEEASWADSRARISQTHTEALGGWPEVDHCRHQEVLGVEKGRGGEGGEDRYKEAGEREGSQGTQIGRGPTAAQ
jgi:hypothetical protein